MVTGYLNGEVVGSTTFSLTPNFVWQELNFGQVDLIEFKTRECDDKHWWLMDNVQVSAIPIPTTIGMFCGGLLALFVFGRRRVGGHSLSVYLFFYEEKFCLDPGGSETRPYDKICGRKISKISIILFGP